MVASGTTLTLIVVHMFQVNVSVDLMEALAS